jgi:hypothetical protein
MIADRIVGMAANKNRLSLPAADAIVLDVTMDLYTSEDSTRGFLDTAKALDQGIEPPDMIFHGR